MTGRRPQSIVYVFQLPDMVIANCAVCPHIKWRRPNSPTHRLAFTAELTEWAHTHATEHTQEPTA